MWRGEATTCQDVLMGGRMNTISSWANDRGAVRGSPLSRINVRHVVVEWIILEWHPSFTCERMSPAEPLPGLEKLLASVLSTASNKWLCLCSISSLHACVTADSLLRRQLPARWLQVHTFFCRGAVTRRGVLQDGTHQVSHPTPSVYEN